MTNTHTVVPLFVALGKTIQKQQELTSEQIINRERTDKGVTNANTGQLRKLL